MLHRSAAVSQLAAAVSQLADALLHIAERALRQIAVELHIVVVLQSLSSMVDCGTK